MKEAEEEKEGVGRRPTTPEHRLRDSFANEWTASAF